jgi:pimeloyl-ACP methyl ester carboxylesterase
LPPYHPFRSEAAKREYLSYYDLRAREWPVPAVERLVKTSQGHTHVRVSGPSEASPLVLLPGINASSLMWLPNVGTLSREMRVYAVDNIYDFGRSAWEQPFNKPDDFVRWLDELFTELSLGNSINLAGISYGGWIASQYALRFPARLRALVLIAPVFTVLPLRVEFIARALLCMIPYRGFTRSFVHWLAQDAVEKNEATRHLVDQMVEDGYLGFRSFAPKLSVAPTILNDEQLRAIKAPTLYVVGENERLNSAAAAIARLNEVAPGIATVLIPGAGHDLTIAQAELFNRTMVEFLDLLKLFDPKAVNASFRQLS